jgi:mRNA interferase YafQ
MKPDKIQKMSIEEFFNELLHLKGSKFDLDYTNSFKKNVKVCYKSDLNLRLLCEVIKILAKEGALPAKYKPHPLVNRKCMECHIASDWLLIWQQNNTELTLLLINTGTHAKILGM